MSDETWYAVVDETGALVSTGTVLADPQDLADKGYVAITLAAAPDLEAQEWDAATRSFVDRPPVVVPTQDKALAQAEDALTQALAAIQAARGA